ncbi:MAG: hypothetical protein EOO16_00280 [Chitinophagaceae bacterium]|nr:MAG: hypothetical protein EOO16_00280 [Chitinophagaceae bacterium]
MNSRVVDFMKQYWWAWLTLFAVTLIIMIIGPTTVGSFAYKAVRGVFLLIIGGAVFVWFYGLTAGEKHADHWSFLRLFAAILLFFAIATGYDWMKDFDPTGESILNLVVGTSAKWQWSRTILGLSIILLGCSFWFYAKGESILYQHQTLEAVKAVKEIHSKLLCPRCKGTGFMDYADLERFGKQDEWGTGVCAYCSGDGHVEKGKVKTHDPETSFPQEDILDREFSLS